MQAHLLVFLGVAALLTITPGADMAIVTRSALTTGWRAAFFTTLGINTGLFVWSLASAFGIAALLSASATAFNVLKIGGSIYLIGLGLWTIWQTRISHKEGKPDHERNQTVSAVGNGTPFRQGFFSNLFNPKIAIFYTAFLPQFIDPHASVLLWSLLLASIHNLMGLLWLSCYAYLITRVGQFLRRPAIKRLLDRLTGTVLILLGLRLAFEER